MKKYEEILKTYNSYLGLAEHYGRYYNKSDRKAGEQSGRIALWRYVSQPSVPHEHIPVRYIKRAVMVECIRDKQCLKTTSEALAYLEARTLNNANETEDICELVKEWDKDRKYKKNETNVRKAAYKGLANRGGYFEEARNVPLESNFDVDRYMFEHIPDEMPKDLRGMIRDRLSGVSFREMAEKRGCSYQAANKTLRNKMAAWLLRGGKAAQEMY